MITEALYLTLSSSGDASGNGLTWEKELIYIGEFVKGDVKFNVTEKLIDHWVKEFSAMSQHGFKVKLPVEHTFDPEQNRGHIVSLSKKLDSKGRIALFGAIEFLDAEAAKLAHSTDVSIYSPPTYTMGNGYTANRPITHVALTDYPVVPGLDPFETLAASLKEVMKMSMKDLADKLGLTVPAEVTDEAAIAELIMAEMQKLKDAVAAASGGASQGDQQKTSALEASMTSMMKELRASKIDGLVSACKLTPAEAASWKKTYVQAETISLSNVDGFDAAFSLAQQRQAFTAPGEKTSPQAKFDPNNNPLMADAKRRTGA
jgi:hypothetical protein